MTRVARLLTAALVLLASVASASAQDVEYRFSFPEPEHRWMQVEATFSSVPAGALELHMSRSSPGRYALHEFAKNVYDLTAVDGDNRPLAVSRPNAYQWRVADHGPIVRVRYRVFGDRIDGTYLAIDSTHAHINMPAAVMWARGWDDRPITVRFAAPAGAAWRVATQLFPTGDPNTFSAPNLQYLMDSPSELSAFALRTFTVPDGTRRPQFRLAVHHQGSDSDLDSFTREVEKIVREERAVFGEFAAFETNTYTFIADYLPWANGDGMEHRNSTIVTSTGSLRTERRDLLDGIAHEFFHSWNVERIRPRSLEPYNLDDTNMSSELWLAEGFTQYFGPLTLARAGIASADELATELGNLVDEVVNSPARLIRTAEEMSQFAPFVDAAASVDRSNVENTYISYYTWGGAIAFGLDLTLRERSAGAVTLDHFMRELWRRHGAPGGRAPGYVDHPYTSADVQNALATVAGDEQFAADFFAKYIRGHEVLDYRRLLALAGLVLRPVDPAAGYAGFLRLRDASGGARLVAPTVAGTPAYRAGLDRDDLIVSFGGVPVRSAADLDAGIRGRKPGERIPIVFERRGVRTSASLTLAANPRQTVLTVEAAGQPLTAEQQKFRAAWLQSRQ